MVFRSVAVTLAAIGLTVVAPHAVADGPQAYIPVADQQAVVVVDTASDRVVHRIDGVGPHASAVTASRDGTRLYVQGFEPQLTGPDHLTVVDPVARTVVGRVALPGPDGPTRPIADPVRDNVYVLTMRPSLEVVDTATDTVVRSTPLPFVPFAAAIAPDGSRLYVVFADSTAAAYDPETGFQIGERIQIDGSVPAAAAVSPDGRTLYSVNVLGDNVSIVDTATWRRTGAISFGAGSAPVAAAVAPDGARLLVATLGADAVQVVDLATQRVTGSVPVDAPVSVSFTDDGTKMYVGSLGPRTDASPIAALGLDLTAALPVFLQGPPRPGALVPFTATDLRPTGQTVVTGVGQGAGSFPS